jgi:5-methylcytosine-specific restriction protein A
MRGVNTRTEHTPFRAYMYMYNRAMLFNGTPLLQQHPPPTLAAMTWNTTPRQQRGYGAAWERLRLRILTRDGYMCQCDLCQGLGLPASHVDHIVRKTDGGTDDPSNLRSLNKDCHKRISIIQAGKTPRAPVAIGLDGYPIHTPPPHTHTRVDDE